VSLLKTTVTVALGPGWWIAQGRGKYGWGKQQEYYACVERNILITAPDL